MRAGAQRRPGGRDQSRYRAGGKAGNGAVGRSRAPRSGGGEVTKPSGRRVFVSTRHDWRAKTSKFKKSIGGNHATSRPSAGAARGYQGRGPWPRRGNAGRCIASATRRCRGGGGRRDLGQRILGKEGRYSIVDVSQAAGRAEGRRAFAAGAVLRAWLF